MIKAEIIPVISRKIIEMTPPFAQERVANAILRLSEQRVAQETNSEDTDTRILAKWYQKERNPEQWRINRMGINERIWLLLEGSLEDKTQWLDIMTSNSSDFDQIELAKLFKLRILEGRDKGRPITAYSEARSSLFSTFLESIKNPDPKVRSSFLRKITAYQNRPSESSTDLSRKFKKE